MKCKPETDKAMHEVTSCMIYVERVVRQYQKTMTYLPQSIVRTAVRTGQTAVASIPRLMLSGLPGPVPCSLMCFPCLARGLRYALGIVRWPFTPEAIFSGNPLHRRTSVLQTGGIVKRAREYGYHAVSAFDNNSGERLLHV